MRKYFGVILALLIAIAVGGYLYKRSNTEQQGLPTKGGESLSIKIPVPYFAQGDSRWAKDRLGESGDLMGSYGCTVCSATMALNVIGKEVNPKELNHYLSNNSGFTENGLLIWDTLRKYAGNPYSIVIKDRTTHAYLDQQLKQGNPIISKVLWQGQIWHWVLITGKQDDQYLIADPLEPDDPHISAEDYSDGFFSIRHLKK